MTRANVEAIRNVVLCGHGSSGKTTIADSLLHLTGTVNETPSVVNGTSVCDFDPEEKEHKYSIEASCVHFEYNNHYFNLVDTPGYPDFIGQFIGTLAAVDTAVIVVNAHSGIEVNTRHVFEEAEKAGVGKIIAINKIDDENVDFQKIVDDIREMWGTRCVLLNVPVGQGADFKKVVSTLNVPADTSGALLDPAEISEPLVESIIEVDEAVMERYFEGTPPTDEELSKLIVTAVKEGTLVPIVCTSGKQNIGLTELLDALIMCGLGPADRKIVAKKDGNEVEITPDPNGPLVAQVFKTRIDPFVQKLSFIRVFSGTIKRDDNIHTSSARKNIKMGHLLRVQGEKTEGVDSAGPGEIVAVAKMEELHTGTSLGEYELPSIHFPTPMVGLAVSPKSRGDETKLSGALQKIVEEDPTFKLSRDSQTKELVMTGMSELHLTIIQERLKRRDKLEVETKEPKIPFRETIQTEAEGSYRHKKQSGGRGQFGEVHIRMFPLPHDTEIDQYATKSRFHSIKDYHYDKENNFLWVDSVVGGVIPGNFMPAIGKGFKERIDMGVIAGFQVQDVCVEVHFGKHHPVDSSEAAFKTAARQAFKQVFEKAKPSLLEPVVTLDVTVPEANVGDVYSDMSGRGGRVNGSDAIGGNFSTIHCEVPLREVTTYSRSLSSMTGGLGSYTMKFSHYEPVPPNIQQEIVSKAQLHEEDDE
jgi:elongation factor G